MPAATSGPVHTYAGLQYRTDSHVYVPHDDTWLLVDAVNGLPELRAGVRVLEVGCGAGLGLIAAMKRGANGIGLDRNRAAVCLAMENAQRNQVDSIATWVQADLLGPVSLERIDWVLFNPPYLPTAPEERLPGDLNLAFDGGPTGNETIRRFLDALAGQQARPNLLLVTSSLNDRHGFRKRLAALGYGEPEQIATRSFPFERLFVEAYRPA